jgi:hypothetical protein
MPITAEDRARQNIERLLTDVGWLIQSRDATNTNLTEPDARSRHVFSCRDQQVLEILNA